MRERPESCDKRTRRMSAAWAWGEWPGVDVPLQCVGMPESHIDVTMMQRRCAGVVYCAQCVRDERTWVA